MVPPTPRDEDRFTKAFFNAIELNRLTEAVIAL